MGRIGQSLTAVGLGLALLAMAPSWAAAIGRAGLPRGAITREASSPPDSSTASDSARPGSVRTRTRSRASARAAGSSAPKASTVGGPWSSVNATV